MHTEITGEIGINHNGSVEIAIDIMRMASKCGVDSVKFQKRTPDICVPEHQKMKMKDTPWGEMTYLDYRKRMEFNQENYLELIDEAKKLNLRIFASVWDMPSAVFCRQAGFDWVKIPSAAITDLPLLDYCKTSFPFRLMSTGMSDEAQIDKAVERLDPHVIYHCCAEYPAKYENLNLLRIPYMIDKYPGRIIGYSGHETGLTTTECAVALGAKYVERHITLDHTMWGSDHAASVGPVGVERIVRGIRDIEKALGRGGPRVIQECEKSKLSSLRRV